MHYSSAEWTWMVFSHCAFTGIDLTQNLSTPAMIPHYEANETSSQKSCSFVAKLGLIEIKLPQVQPECALESAPKQGAFQYTGAPSQPALFQACVSISPPWIQPRSLSLPFCWRFLLFCRSFHPFRPAKADFHSVFFKPHTSPSLFAWSSRTWAVSVFYLLRCTWGVA